MPVQGLVAAVSANHHFVVSQSEVSLRDNDVLITHHSVHGLTIDHDDAVNLAFVPLEINLQILVPYPPE